MIETATGVTATRLLWCGEAICQARNATDAPLAYHYPQGELRGSQRLYYATDHLGSVREVRNLASGQTVAAFDYGPYGATTSQTGTLTPARGYAGMWRHAPTGLYLTHYRAYSPQYGRWLTRDPINEAGGVNLYAYVGNSPVNRVDPDGRFAMVIACPACWIPPAVIVAKCATDLWKVLNETDDGADSEAGPEREKTPSTDPGNFEPVRGTKGKKDKESGEIWEKDKFHKDHWEVYGNKRDYEKGKRDRDVWDDGRSKRKF